LAGRTAHAPDDAVYHLGGALLHDFISSRTLIHATKPNKRRVAT
jgi:hypothetical protein